MKNLLLQECKYSDMNARKYKILLVEDERLLRFIINAFFKKLGVELDEAKNGLEAVEKFKENDYDLILMDIQMPIMDGFEAVELMRRMEKEDSDRKRTKIVAVTTNHDKEKCLESGMDSYYQKPIMMEEIVQIVNELDSYEIARNR